LPIRKIQVAALGGAISTLVVFLMEQYGHVQIPAAVATAITTILSFLISYFVPPAAQDNIVEE
jgi:uncharacterized membrane protein YjjB (DUF3815 family)